MEIYLQKSPDQFGDAGTLTPINYSVGR